MAQGFDPGELRLRTLSAVALGALAFACLWLHQISFAVLVVVLTTVMAWEWGRAVRQAEFDTCFFAHCLGTAVAVVAVTWSAPVFAIAALLLAAGLSFGSAPQGAKTMSALGVVYIGIPAMLAVWLRQDAEFGIWAILFILIVVAAHDTFAMLTGKLLGGPRLWPVLSPNKTWSGVLGGLLASVIAGYVFGISFAGHALSLWLACLGLLLGLAGFAGDLSESAFKRRYQLKNASGLMPGHGGLLDRLDSLIGAMTLAAIIGLAVNSEAPSRALLYLE